MKPHARTSRYTCAALTSLALLIVFAQRHPVAAATLLFEDNFNGGIPGWTAVQPAAGNYLDGPMLWIYDASTEAFSEQSNLYTDSATFSGTRITSMLINGTVAPANFTFSARLTAGDDDAFGLIWGYEDEDSFYRVTFARQNRTTAGWPYQGVIVDRMNNGQITNIFGPDATFVNTANQPFDVTITVNNGLLTLVVTDDPSGSAGGPFIHNLVTDGALPTAPSAKVGLFSWGMSGANPRSFRIQNPVLAPTPLTGDPAGSVLANWSFLITPRGDGSINMNSPAAPVWGQGLSLNGDRGRMIETSDTFLNADNVANSPGNTNYAAASAVAGDVNWTNYIYSARFILSDDDGFGMLLRYQNETNFYRIAFRNQNSQAGVRRGLTIQKNVNFVFDQVYSNSISGFIPPIGVPFEVHASIQDNRLQVIGINNPDSAGATAATTGPIDITGDTLSSGKIGVFSWAMNTGGTTSDAGTEVDWVKVQHVSGEGLLVSSAFGSPEPPSGLNDYPANTVITAKVDTVINTSPQVRQVLVGWTGFGSVPSSGATNEVVFTLAGLSGVTWKWQTEYLLATNTTPGGSVSASRGPWVPANSNVTATATADAGYLFTGWSGDSVSTLPMLTFPMGRPVSLTAHFAPDLDQDGMADNWELQFFGTLSSNALDHADGDALTNLEEYQLGTNPTHAESLIAADGLDSKWLNVQRDVALPSQLRVVDFGSGFRGAWDDSNDNRSANDYTFIPAANGGNYASFQSPRVIVKSNLWTESWASNFTATIEFIVGDNDANCFYFRYLNESNWFRATLCGEFDLDNVARPRIGLSIQRRLNGKYDQITTTTLSGQPASAYTDPTDNTVVDPTTGAGYKRVRLTVSATNENFEIRSAGWDAVVLAPPAYDLANELVVTFTDTNHSSGRIGFGLWGQGGYSVNSNQVHGLEVPFGAMVDNIALKSPADGATVFAEDWETAPLTNQFPAGWTNPYEGVTGLGGVWHMSAHGTIAQQANQGLSTTGTANSPKGDADGPILIAPNPMSANYHLQLGFHPFDDDGIGFVYDYQDTNNFSRVLFCSGPSPDGGLGAGLTISRKSGGVWSDIVAGDASFIYVPGRPFDVTFANNNGDYTLIARDRDNPANTAKWHWNGTPAATGNRFGVAVWSFQDAHFLYARAYSLPTLVPSTPFKITNISISSGNVILDISKPEGSSYHVLRATDVSGPYTTNAANQAGSQYSEALPVGDTYFYRLQLLP